MKLYLGTLNNPSNLHMVPNTTAMLPSKNQRQSYFTTQEIITVTFMFDLT